MTAIPKKHPIELVEKIKELSATHTIPQIAKILEADPKQVRNIQDYRPYGIENPKRVITRHRKDRGVKEGFFDVDEFAKHYMF